MNLLAGKKISQEQGKISKLVITHLTPDIVETLKQVLAVINRADTGLELILTKPAEKVGIASLLSCLQ